MRAYGAVTSIAIGSVALLLGGLGAPANAAAGVGPTETATPTATLPTFPTTRIDGVVSAFTLVVPKTVSKSQLQARAVIARGSTCPRLLVVKTNGRRSKLTMTVRAPGATTGSAFASVRACQRNVPKGTARAFVGTTEVPAALARRIDKIAILGDTGCDIDAGQACADPTAWPAALNARRIAHSRPDLTVLLGDYFYRENPCPADAQARCGGSPPSVAGMPFRDSDYAWIADALAPLAPVFSAAPILAMRGNHEACDRGGNGYFLFFDASPLGPAACAPDLANKLTANITPSWAVDLPITAKRTLRAVVVDSAYGFNKEISPWSATQRIAYQQAARLAAAKTGRESWLLTHRPSFGVESTLLSKGKPTWAQWSAVDQTAASEGLLGTYTMILSSHLHVAQVVHVPGYPNQVVIGNGGTVLDPTTGYTTPPFGPLQDGIGTPLSPDYTSYPTANYLWTQVRYGYTIAKPLKKAGTWQLAFKSDTGHGYASCTLGKRRASCR